MDNLNIQSNSAGWLFFIKISFAIALLAMAVGIVCLQSDLLTQGYFTICALFMVNATITLSKTLRDEHESQRLISKINEAKTNKILNEFTE